MDQAAWASIDKRERCRHHCVIRGSKADLLGERKA
jgi:hypothetical protein